MPFIFKKQQKNTVFLHPFFPFRPKLAFFLPKKEKKKTPKITDHLNPLRFASLRRSSSCELARLLGVKGVCVDWASSAFDGRARRLVIGPKKQEAKKNQKKYFSKYIDIV